MNKSPTAFRTITEVAEWLETPAHVLRFWESKFSQIKPVKRTGGRRYYRPADMALLGGIKKLLHEDGMTIRGVQKLLREQGVEHVSSFSTNETSLQSEPSDIADQARDAATDEAPMHVDAPEDLVPLPSENKNIILSFPKNNSKKNSINTSSTADNVEASQGAEQNQAWRRAVNVEMLRKSNLKVLENILKRAERLYEQM